MSLYYIYLYIVIGGLLSAHLLLYKATRKLDPGWPCEGQLLDLARRAAEKLLPGEFMTIKVCAPTVYQKMMTVKILLMYQCANYRVTI